MRVLIVEDEVAVARQIASALTEAGHDPKAVHDGETALEEVRKTPFDLIVLDIRLPGIVVCHREWFRESDFQFALRLPPQRGVELWVLSERRPIFSARGRTHAAAWT